MMIYSGRQVFVAQASKSFHKPQAALIGFLPMEYFWGVAIQPGSEWVQ